MKEYNHVLDSFGGASPSVIPQPGDEAVCEGVRGYSCMTSTLPKGLHLEVMSMQNRDTSFPYRLQHSPPRLVPHVKSTREEDPLTSNRTKVGELYSLQWRRMGGHRPHPESRERVPAAGSVQEEGQIPNDRRVHQIGGSESTKAETAKFDQEIDTETMEGLIAAGWSKSDIDWIRREHGGWWQPWCIRASSGHSDFGLARPAELCNILFPNMSDRLGGAFDVTKPSALEGIILRGIVPGGNDSSRRLAVHFGEFAPWDSENISTKTAMHDVKEGDDLIAIYVPTRKLSVCQSGVTSGGTIVVFETI